MKCCDYELWLWHPPVLVRTLVIQDTCSETWGWLFTLSVLPNKVDAQQLLLHMGGGDACHVCVNSQSFIEVHVWSRTCVHTQLSVRPLYSLRSLIPNKNLLLFLFYLPIALSQMQKFSGLEAPFFFWGCHRFQTMGCVSQDRH